MNPENTGIIERSGAVTYMDKLTSFLYELMRDHLPPGVIEELVRDSQVPETHFCNGWLAQYANDVAKRLQNE